jgi:hypothetical protein
VTCHRHVIRSPHRQLIRPRGRYTSHLRAPSIVLPNVTTVKVMLGAMAMGSLAMAAALIWLVVARLDHLLSLIW